MLEIERPGKGFKSKEKKISGNLRGVLTRFVKHKMGNKAPSLPIPCRARGAHSTVLNRSQVNGVCMPPCQ